MQLGILNSGIDWSMPGNGGPDCLAFHSLPFRLAEAAFVLALSAVCLHYGVKKHHVPDCLILRSNPHIYSRELAMWLTLLVMVTYFLELGYKMVTQQLIFMINPCHVLCLMHLFLLCQASKPLHTATLYLFRLHLFFLHGPLMAVLFPVTNTLLLPGEVAVYWIEHALLLTVPLFLLKVYPVPDRQEWLSWGLMAFGVWGTFHYAVLLPMGLWTQANLNSILCPAISDPFRGPYYRLHAVWHQFLMTIICGVALNSLGTRPDLKAKKYPHTLDTVRNGFTK